MNKLKVKKITKDITAMLYMFLIMAFAGMVSYVSVFWVVVWLTFYHFTMLEIVFVSLLASYLVLYLFRFFLRTAMKPLHSLTLLSRSGFTMCFVAFVISIVVFACGEYVLFDNMGLYTKESIVVTTISSLCFLLCSSLVVRGYISKKL
ncbi:MAG: hypothetical protein MJ007_03970 [Paludibacteraceae bacterium]|nr:hypothetical protein [Paludibacteraceae bacterium]